MNENKDIENYNNETFESIKHVDENGVEFWYARELMKALDYASWDKFKKVIEKAKISCENSNVAVAEQFSQQGKSLNIPNGATKFIGDYDYKLTRYACYLIAQNGSSTKKQIAQAQTYFAVQTRKQELTEKEYTQLTEDEKRFYQRNLTRKGNYSLNQIVLTSSIPFRIEIPKLNAETIEAIEDVEKGIGLSKGYTDLDEMWGDLELEDE